MTLLESSMHSSSDLPEIDEHEPSEGADEGNETDGDSGSYMSSSFYASDQGEDSEDESQPHGPSKVASPPLPPVQVQPTNTLPGLPFLPLKEISSYLSLEDLASLYRTHRQLRSTIDEGSQSFFGRFWTYSPKSEWVNRARRAHGWHEPIVTQEEEEEEQEAGTVGDGRRRERASRDKMSEIGMDEFWKQIRSAFWVTSFPWDRNDRAMIQQSFWSNLLSPENSPPPEPSPSKFSSSSSPSPVPQSHTRILRPTLSAGYRAYAQHGYVLTGVHHLLLLQRQVCWQCLFCPEEGSQGPEIKILKGGGGRGRTVVSATTTTNADDGGVAAVVGAGAGASSPSSKVCEGCGAATCGRHPTSSETARSLAVELSFLPTPPPAHGHFLFHTLQSMRDVIVASSQGQNPLQVYYRRRNAADENSDWVAAHFGAAQAQAALAAGFGGGLGGGGGNGTAAAAAAGGGNLGAGAGGGGFPVLGGPGGPGPAPVPAGFGGAFIAGGGGAFFGGGPGAGAGPFGAIGVGGANANANPNHPFFAPPPPPPPAPVQVVITIGNPPPPPPPAAPQPQLLPQFQQAQAQAIAQQPNPFPVPVPVPIQPQPQPQHQPPGFHVAHNPYQHGGGPGERPAIKDLWVCAQCAKQFGGFGWSRRGANGADGF